MECDHGQSGPRPFGGKALTSDNVFEECLAAGSDASEEA
jgi:hypothetical protein